MADYNKLKMHCEKLERMVTILKSAGCTVDAPLKTRYEIIKICLTRIAYPHYVLLLMLPRAVTTTIFFVTKTKTL